MDLKEADILGDRIGQHWYYRTKAKALARMLEARPIVRVLDVGAGSGFFARHLLRTTAAAEAWCVDTSYEAETEGQEAGKPIHFRRSVAASDADLVLLMDVLEHVDDDVALLAQYRDKVAPGTRFLVSVPAFQWLWSGHDVFLDHKRRYTLAQVEDVARRAGLRVLRGAYGFGTVLPLAATMRVAGRMRSRADAQPHSQLRQHHPFVNETLALLSAIELPLLRANRFAGLTAFCLAEAP